uniref:P2X purinoreceptor 7 intracellular domain-containing protein n=1 Tax=Sphaeramia orbicularis TaxID=375764 RepID=A0A673CQC6_9TELE
VGRESAGPVSGGRGQRGLFAREPGLVFDALISLQGTPTLPPAAALPWCTCGNCREMATDAERKCCGQGPDHYISKLPHFELYCLEDGYLRLHRQYRNDVLVVGEPREPGDDNRQFRYAAYLQYIFWQHGALSQGNRHVIPSCCVWRVRDKYPDPQGQYTGFVPTI